MLLPLAAGDGELGARRALRRPDFLLASLERGELALALLLALLVRVAAVLTVGILPLGLLLVVLGVVARLVARLGEHPGGRIGGMIGRRLFRGGDAAVDLHGLDRRCGHRASALGPRGTYEIPYRAPSLARVVRRAAHSGGGRSHSFNFGEKNL